jgi:hypothetical protein
MKKINAFFLLSIVTLLLTACGSSSVNISGDNQDSSSTDQTRLSWVPPTTHADGSYLPLSELEGYRIYYGTSASSLSVLVDLNDDSITEYTVNTLPSGNYYFAVSAYDTDGTESELSNIINIDV